MNAHNNRDRWRFCHSSNPLMLLSRQMTTVSPRKVVCCVVLQAGGRWGAALLRPSARRLSPRGWRRSCASSIAPSCSTQSWHRWPSNPPPFPTPYEATTLSHHCHTSIATHRMSGDIQKTSHVGDDASLEGTAPPRCSPHTVYTPLSGVPLSDSPLKGSAKSATQLLFPIQIMTLRRRIAVSEM